DEGGKPAPTEYVLRGENVFATQEPGLAHAQLRRGVDELCAFEARQVPARELQRSENALAGLILHVRLILDAERVQVWNVRAVAPHHTINGRAQPPILPRSAINCLDLLVEPC